MGKSKELAELGDVVTQSGGKVSVGSTDTLDMYSGWVRGYGLYHDDHDGTKDHQYRTYVYNDGFAVSRHTASSGFGAYEAELMRIDASGRVTMPYQPSFQAWSNSGGNEHFAGGTNPSFLTIGTNVGNHFNGTTFTAPVSGRYLFFYTILSGSSGSYGLIALNVNGGPAVGSQNWTQHYTSTTNGQQNSGQQILTLSANDQVNLYIHPTYNRFYWNGAYSKFGGYLIG